MTRSQAEEAHFVASQWQLIWRKFRRHRLARLGAAVIATFVVLAVFAEFWSPYDIYERHTDLVHLPPQRVRLLHAGKLHRPFVYGVTSERSTTTFFLEFSEDRSQRYPVRFFVQGADYKVLGLFPSDIHFFGVDEPGVIHLLGTESIGRDVLSRILYATRVSLSVGLVGIAISFILGCLLGGVSGYFGGAPDMIIQRIIEFLQNIPQIPLWMALSAALPPVWPIIQVYFGITIILSIFGWTGLARVVRGKLLATREEDYVLAAKIAGSGESRIMVRHLLPSFTSYLIVSITLAIPQMILGETALSFLGIGMRPPAVSWGVLLQQAQNIRSVTLYPWLIIPALLVILTVLAFNFLGDGLRDAADPYK
ncbi:MAG: ABC transporter permease [Spirochaetaceae bacterium]|nr:ABC transporter permease [Spirochaetaceae bacterium]